MNIKIDGRLIKVRHDDKNIVDVADREKIGIPAPCYHAQRKQGCCNSCVVEINGKHRYACSTSPENGMEIIVNREDLIALRKERLLKYKTGIENGNPCECRSSNNCE